MVLSCHDRARREILQQKRLYHISTSTDGKTVSAICEGSHPEDKYKLRITLEGIEPAIECTCPAKEKEALCNHSLGLLLWRAGNLTEERLRKQAECASHPQQHPADAIPSAAAAGQHEASQAPVSEQATIAYQTEAPTSPAVASTAAKAGKRRLPASFAKRPVEPAAKKGRANKQETSPKHGPTVASSPAKARSRLQVRHLCIWSRFVPTAIRDRASQRLCCLL